LDGNRLMLRLLKHGRKILVYNEQAIEFCNL
jgi:hypothetical protein